MTGKIDARLKELGIELPTPAGPRGNYLPVVLSNGFAHVAGQVPFWNNELQFVGQVGTDFTVEEGQQAARLCGLNMLAQLKVALEGDLDRIKRAVRLNGFIRCGPDFDQHPMVINGVSDFMAEIFGESGRHARSAVGCVSLPLGVAVEVDGTFEID